MEICAACMTETGDPLPETRDDSEEDTGWSAVPEAHGLLHSLPCVGVGSVGHAADTMLLLIQGPTADKDRSTPNIQKSRSRPAETELYIWNALCIMEVCLQQGSWDLEVEQDEPVFIPTPTDQPTSEPLRRDQ